MQNLYYQLVGFDKLAKSFKPKFKQFISSFEVFNYSPEFKSFVESIPELDTFQYKKN